MQGDRVGLCGGPARNNSRLIPGTTIVQGHRHIQEIELTKFVDGLDVDEYDIEDLEMAGFCIRCLMLLTSYCVCLIPAYPLKKSVYMLPPVETFPLQLPLSEVTTLSSYST